MTLKRFVIAAIFLISAAVIPGLAQGPLHKEVYFTIDAPFELAKTHTVLPPGKYILYEINANNPNVFALYREDKMHSPIAMLTTVRIDYSARKYPGKTSILLDTDEGSPQNYPVLQGWNVPGEDGWDVIGGVSSESTTISTYEARHASSGSHHRRY